MPVSGVGGGFYGSMYLRDARKPVLKEMCHKGWNATEEKQRKSQGSRGTSPVHGEPPGVPYRGIKRNTRGRLNRLFTNCSRYTVFRRENHFKVHAAAILDAFTRKG